MTQPDLARLEGLVAESGFTRLVADYVPDDPLGEVEPGWRIHDFPPDTVFAMFLADGLDEGQAKLIVAAVNSLPALLARVRELEKERDAFRTQAINRGWNWRMCDAYGREEYERQIANEIDRTHEIMLGKKTLEQTFHDDAALTLNRSETDAG